MFNDIINLYLNSSFSTLIYEDTILNLNVVTSKRKSILV